MSAISVAEMLKLYGKWVSSADFVNFVSKKRGIGVRQAYNLIKKSVVNGEILRVEFSGVVLYGLPEFGRPPDVSSKQALSNVDYRLVRLRDKLEKIKDIALYGDMMTAFNDAFFWICDLDEPHKSNLLRYYEALKKAYADVNGFTLADTLLRRQRTLEVGLSNLFREMFNVLHEFESRKPQAS